MFLLCFAKSNVSKVSLAISKLYLTNFVANGLPEFGRKASSKQKPMSPGIKLLGEGWFNLISGFQNRTWMRGMPALWKRRQNSRLLKTWVEICFKNLAPLFLGSGSRLLASYFRLRIYISHWIDTQAFYFLRRSLQEIGGLYKGVYYLLERPVAIYYFRADSIFWFILFPSPFSFGLHY